MKQKFIGLPGLNKYLRYLPEEAGDQLRQASDEIADRLREDRHVSVGHYVEEVIRDHLRAEKVRMAEEDDE